MVRFLLNGEVVALDDVDPTETALNLLRYRLRLVGTKEGCAEGDCGACTVLVGELDGDDRLLWRALNACILFVPMLDGRAVVTVEQLSASGALHPVQRELVERHGSQCGFCTPGFVMSLYGRSLGALGTEDASVADVIAGNLCRCTGYGPILAAGAAVAVERVDDAPTVEALKALRRDQPLALSFQDPSSGTVRRWFSPRTIAELAGLAVAHPQAHILAGATDVGLWVTKQLRTLGDIIWIGEVAELRSLEQDEAGLTLGAGVRYSEARAALARLAPDLGELVRRIGGVQVRNAGTIGGNIANGSPIGDMAPALIALGAVLTLRRGEARRQLPLEAYFLAYGQQDRRPGEFVESIWVPTPSAATLVRIVKLSKRFESDISAVCAAVALRIEEGVVADARIAFGGMAATPARAPSCEAALIGRPWSEAAAEDAAQALAQDYAPLTDLRGSSAYRLIAAGNVLRRLWLETAAPSEPMTVLAPGLADA
jgi:xanthine dehydrogenase small subunit